MTVRCLFGFSGEKPFLLPDNEGVKMNTSPVRMDDLPLNRFHCRIAALTFGAHLTDGYVLGVIGYAIIQLTPAMQLTPFMAGMIGGSALLGLFLGSLVLGWISDHIGRQKIFTFSFLLLAATLVVMACLPSGSSLTLLLFVLFSTTISAVSNLVGILPAESFPTDIRSLGVGFATAMSRLGAAVSTGLLPWVLAQWGMQATLLLLAAVLLVGFVVTWLWAPETKALPLVAAGNVGGANEHSVSV
ncbi:MFS transporter [Escherichia coli]|nr:MFS transporter [Escherichia coli]ELO4871189.1 MFS transporter [Escherichia coli]